MDVPSDLPRTGRFDLLPPVLTQQLEAGVGRAAEFADVAKELQEEAPCLCVYTLDAQDSRNSS